MRQILIIFAGCAVAFTSLGQTSSKDVMEEVYLHVNETELISGETLLFSAFVRSAATGKLSTLSTILYVEILDHKGIPVYQTKVKISDGRGQGDYFISSLLTTGSYHLVAYTRWMKNFEQYFHLPVVIINPFEEFNQSAAEQGGIQLTFFPEGGTLKSGSRNRVAVKAASNNGIGLEVKGRIVSVAGEKMADFVTDDQGVGSFTITPQSGNEYQAIIEDAVGNFIFYDLPDPCMDCTQIRVSETSTGFLVTLEGNPSSGRIVVRDRQNNWIDSEVQIPGQLSLSKSKLPNRLLSIEVYDGLAELIHERLIFNGELKSGSVSLKSRYGLREKVTPAFDLTEAATVSISVKQVHSSTRPIGINDGFALTDGLTDFPDQIPSSETLDNLLLISQSDFGDQQTDSIMFLPELRNDFFDGQADGPEVGKLPVSISLPGEGFQFQAVNMDERGHFTIGVTPVYEDQNAFYKVLSESNNYEITIENEFYSEYPEFIEPVIQFDSARIKRLIQRSINNQIENAYYAFQADSLAQFQQSPNQFEITQAYILDDYTRFPTLRDTFIEYIPEVGVRKNESNYQMKIRLINRFPGEDNPSLILLDGLPVQAEQVMDLSPYAIQSINVLNQRFYFGDVILDGILSFVTIDGNYAGIDPKATPVQLKSLQLPKIYTFPDHTSSTSLPDRRDQLFWDPLVRTDGSYTFDFFTSDVPGTYEIRVEGISDSGEPISLREEFMVGQ